MNEHEQRAIDDVLANTRYLTAHAEAGLHWKADGRRASRVVLWADITDADGDGSVYRTGPVMMPSRHAVAIARRLFAMAVIAWCKSWFAANHTSGS